jgi:hypothetical protein
MSAATGGAYNPDFLDLDGMLGMITGLSGMGMDMGMCNVFSALSHDIPHLDMLSKASGSLLGKASSSRNVMGMLDIAGSSAGLHPKAFNPSAITGMLKGFRMPTSVRAGARPDLANRFTGAMELIDVNHGKSQYDDTISTHGVENTEYRSLMHQRSLDNVYTSNNLNTAPVDDYSFYSAAF